jgi:hypothetical protein
LPGPRATTAPGTDTPKFGGFVQPVPDHPELL